MAVEGPMRLRMAVAMESIHPGRELLRNSAPWVMTVTPLKRARLQRFKDGAAIRTLIAMLSFTRSFPRQFPLFHHANPHLGQVYAATTLIGRRPTISEQIAGESSGLFYSRG